MLPVDESLTDMNSSINIQNNKAEGKYCNFSVTLICRKPRPALVRAHTVPYCAENEKQKLEKVKECLEACEQILHHKFFYIVTPDVFEHQEKSN